MGNVQLDPAPGSGNVAPVRQEAPDLLYDRTTRTQVRITGGLLVITGRLTDESLGLGGYVRVHDMGLEITCEPESMTIVEASADMVNHPHGLCPLMVPRVDSLVGLTITAGYLAEVRKRMGGVRGCNHLYALAQQVGTVAALTFAARFTHAEPALSTLQPHGFYQEVVDKAPGVVNSCYIWREDGEVATALRRADGERDSG